MEHRAIPLWSRAIACACFASVAAAQTELWSAQLGTPQTEKAYALAPDGVGGAFVGGTTAGALATPANGLDLWMARYDAGGAPLWVRQFGNQGTNVVMGGASDGAGLFYTTGYTEYSLAGSGAGSYDAFVIVMDGTGTVTWFEQFGTATIDIALAAAADGAGGAFVCGTTDGALGGAHMGDYDAWVAHVDAGGVNWIRQLGTIASDKANSLSLDGAGGVYVGGESEGPLGGPASGFPDAWLARLDGAGNLLWSRQIGSGGFDPGLATASDPGGVFLAGATNATLGQSSAGNFDAWVARFDLDGNLAWLTQFGGGANEWVGGLSLDGAGGVILGGRTTAPIFGEITDSDGLLARLDADGTLLWSVAVGSPDKDDAVWRVAIDPAGDLFLAGDTWGDLGGTHLGWGDAWIARFDADCAAGGAYCSPSATSIAGCVATLGAAGTPSAGHPAGFTLSTAAIPGGNLGLCLFGADGAASTPFGTLGGVLCVKAPLFRTAPSATGGSTGQCDGLLDFTLAELAAASGVVVSGATLHAQVWARDPANPDGFLLSDGWTFAVCP
jgi:hypothetical protein